MNLRLRLVENMGIWRFVKNEITENMRQKIGRDLVRVYRF